MEYIPIPLLIPNLKEVSSLMPPFFTFTRHSIVWDLAVQFFFFKFDELVRTKNIPSNSPRVNMT